MLVQVVTRPAENEVMSVSELSNSGAPMKAAIGVPLAALTRNETSCADDRPSECLNSSAEPWPSRSCSVRKVDIASEIAWPALLPLVRPRATIAAPIATASE